MKVIGKSICNFGLTLFLIFLNSAHANECDKNESISKIIRADQADLQLPMEKYSEVLKNRAARQKQVEKNINCGALKSGYDWYSASIIMIHGDSISDLVNAIEYAKRAQALDAELSNATRNMMANAWDKIMIKIGKKQWFGTQFNSLGYLPVEKCLITHDEMIFFGVNEKVIAEQDRICPNNK